jgi:hypothetical protein
MNSSTSMPLILAYFFISASCSSEKGMYSRFSLNSSSIPNPPRIFHYLLVFCIFVLRGSICLSYCLYFNLFFILQVFLLLCCSQSLSVNQRLFTKKIIKIFIIHVMFSYMRNFASDIDTMATHTMWLKLIVYVGLLTAALILIAQIWYTASHVLEDA